jgi:hypothetical protein
MMNPRQPDRLPLALAIALALALKALLLSGLWLAFFSAPQAPRMRMPASQVAAHLLVAPSRDGK